MSWSSVSATVSRTFSPAPPPPRLDPPALPRQSPWVPPLHTNRPGQAPNQRSHSSRLPYPWEVRLAPPLDQTALAEERAYQRSWPAHDPAYSPRPTERPHAPPPFSTAARSEPPPR